MSLDHGFPSSPYLVGPPVLEPDGFYGREEQIQTFFQNVNGQRMHSQRILGARRSGKTSFLRHVANPRIYEQWISGRRLPAILAYVNLQGAVTEPLHFFCEVAKAIASAAPNAGDITAPRRFEDVRDFDLWLVGVCGRYRVVALLDEFESLTQSAKFDLDFFRKLRSLASGNFELAWVTASYRDVVTLSKPPGTKDLASPLYNIFQPDPIYLGPLAPEEATALVSEPASSCGIDLSKNEIREIRRLSGDMPFFLQATADKWFRARAAGMPDGELQATIAEQLLSPGNLIREQLAGFWASLSVKGRRILKRLPDRRDVRSDAENRDTLLILQKYGFLYRQNDRLRPAGELFQRWIKELSNTAPGVPHVFVGHGRSPLWLEVRNVVERDFGLIAVCFDSEPRAGQSIVPILEEMMDKAEFAIVVVTAEDETAEGTVRPRQNVVHEAGLCQGNLGFEKVILLVQEGVEFWNNLDGMQSLRFTGDNIKETFWDLRSILRDRQLPV